MPEPTQHSRRRHRLLLLAGLGIGAGLGITLAAGSPAHADDQPTPIVDTVHAVAEPPRQIVNATAPQVKQPQPVRDLTAATRNTTAQALNTTTTAVTRTTDRLDEATQPAPVVGRTVGQVTFITGNLLGAASPIAPAEPATPALASAADPAEAQPATGTPTAPEPAPPGPPTPDGASSGAPTHTAAQHPAARPTGHPHKAATPHQQHGQAAAVAAPQPGHIDLDPCGGILDQHESGLHGFEYPAAGGTTGVIPRRPQPATGYAEHHDGRTQPPSPPPG